MYKIKEAVIVEGTYDKIRLSGFLDAIVIQTNGFSIFNDKEKIKTINTLAKKTGIVILTDSDAAGFKIRNFVKQSVREGRVLNAYIPEICGKEKRKTAPSKEGLLGVEGVSEKIIIKALYDCGCEIDGSVSNEEKKKLTKTDLYRLGLSGGENSREKRTALCNKMGIPSKISPNMLVVLLDRLMSLEQLEELLEQCEEK